MTMAVTVAHICQSLCVSAWLPARYVSGSSISHMLDRFGHFSEELVRNYTRQLLQGLEYLHSQRVCHRDVKGGNALVTSDGIIKLSGARQRCALGCKPYLGDESTGAKRRAFRVLGLCCQFA